MHALPIEFIFLSSFIKIAVVAIKMTMIISYHSGLINNYVNKPAVDFTVAEISTEVTLVATELNLKVIQLIELARLTLLTNNSLIM